MFKYLYIILLLSSIHISLFGKGVFAGTTIDNSAAITYTINGIDYNHTSNRDIFVVDQVIDIKLTWLDSSAVEVGAGELQRVLSFRLANWGNGDDNISVVYEHNHTASQFIPLNSHIYLDSDGNGLFEPLKDIRITDINLSADQNITLFLVSDIPDKNITADISSFDGIRAYSHLLNSVTPEDQGKVDIVIRSNNIYAQGELWVRDYWIEAHKRAKLLSDDNKTHTGTNIEYTIELFIGGNAAGRVFSKVSLSDKIPQGTSYLAGTLHLDTKALSDAIDSDDGEVNASHIQVRVGDLVGTDHKSIHFKVIVE